MKTSLLPKLLERLPPKIHSIKRRCKMRRKKREERKTLLSKILHPRARKRKTNQMKMMMIAQALALVKTP